MENSKNKLAALAGLLYGVARFRLQVTGKNAEGEEPLSLILTELVPWQWATPLRSFFGAPPISEKRSVLILRLARLLVSGDVQEAIDHPAGRSLQMTSLLSAIHMGEDRSSPEPPPAFLPLDVLHLSEKTFFPARPMKESDIRGGITDLWNHFKEDMRSLKEEFSDSKEIDLYLESLLGLLKRYAWRVPAYDDSNRSDISLFDHCRMVSALAVLLEESGLEQERLEQILQAPQNAFDQLGLLVAGDISGIQDFIYSISNHGAAYGLRGRSFFIQMLTEIAARYALHHLGLPITNLLYAGGGKFYLLAPFRSNTRDVEAIQKHLSRVLLAQHDGDLRIALAWTPLLAFQFSGKEVNLTQSWQNVQQKLEQRKSRCFAELDEEMPYLFEPHGHGGSEFHQCQECGKEYPQTERERLHPADADGMRTCPACRSFRELGEALREAEYLILEFIDAPALPPLSENSSGESFEETLAYFGFRIKLLRKGQILRNMERRRMVFALSDSTQRGILTLATRTTGIGRHWPVNVMPTSRPGPIVTHRRGLGESLAAENHILDFTTLAKLSEGIDRLGVLRMDVDDLGKIFSEGLGERATLERIAALSFSLSLFFEGWVEHLALEQNRYDADRGWGHRLFAIYSGGDDLCFTGAWDAIFDLAIAIRRDLGRFTAGNNAIHISGGVVLVDDKYPLSQAAEDAKATETVAKSHHRWDGKRLKEKDALCFLGQPLPWRDFFSPQPDTAAFPTNFLSFARWLKGQKDSRSCLPLIHHLILLQRQYLEASKRHETILGNGSSATPGETVLWGPWMVWAQYTLARISDRERDNRWILDIKDALNGEGFQKIVWMGLAARFAELSLRESKETI